MTSAAVSGSRRTDAGRGSVVRAAARWVAYLGVPASTLSAVAGVFLSINVLTAFYLVALLGVVAALRGAKVDRDIVPVTWVLLAWYVVLLLIELVHGGPFHYPLPRGTNYLTDYFPLLAFPFFVVGLRDAKADLRTFDWAAVLTILFTTGLTLYQFLVLGIDRPKGWSLNPVPFAFIMMVWSVYLFSRALNATKIDWLRLAVALIGLVPVVISGSKSAWLCGAIGYSILLVLRVRDSGRWSVLGYIAVALIPIGWLLWQLSFIRARFTEFTGDVGAFFSTGNTSGGSFGLRIGAAVSGFLAFLQRPFLGYGLAEGKSAALEHRPASFSSFAMLPHLHNEYATDLVAFGFLGLVFIVALFVVFVALSARRADVGIRRFGVVAGVMFLVYMTMEVVFTQPEIYGLAFFVFGLVMLYPVSAGERAAIEWWGARRRLAYPTQAAGQQSVVATGDRGAQSWRAGGLRLVLVVLLIGLVGLGWSQRNVFYKVAQTAILQESADDPAHSGSDANQIDASVRWQFAANGPNGPEIVADFDIPATGATVRLVLYKNSDPAVPASHIIEVTTTSSPDFPDKAIAAIEGLLAKPSPYADGTPLVAGVASLGNGKFWIGLSPDQSASDANLKMLTLAPFFDLLVVYKSGQHAILTFEKGQTGTAVFKAGLPALWR